MLRGLAARLQERGRVGSSTWISLAREPARLAWRRGRLEFVALEQAELERYGAAKSAFWDELHGLAPPSEPESTAAGLDALGDALARRACELHDEHAFDVFYAHDFQVLAAGMRLPEGVPRVFRWHGPTRPMSPGICDYVARRLDAYDAVVVSTRAYARELRSWGVRAPIHASYPYLDESRRRVVTEGDLAGFDERYGLRSTDIAFVLVARMDAIKSQDVAIQALARIARTAPDAKLLLVGGGGFSGGRQGLGLAQATDWRAYLEGLARDLGVQDRVVFTGGIADTELDVAFTRARAILLPSVLEGFGLAAVEGWLYGKPVIVSRGAGMAELVTDGENGFTFEPGDDETLSEAMILLARDEVRARVMGAEGRRSARTCHLDRGADDEWGVLRGVLERGATREPPRRR